MRREQACSSGHARVWPSMGSSRRLTEPRCLRSYPTLFLTSRTAGLTVPHGQGQGRPVNRREEPLADGSVIAGERWGNEEGRRRLRAPQQHSGRARRQTRGRQLELRTADGRVTPQTRVPTTRRRSAQATAVVRVVRSPTDAPMRNPADRGAQPSISTRGA